MKDTIIIQGEGFRVISLTYNSEGEPVFKAEGIESGSLIEFRFIDANPA